MTSISWQNPGYQQGVRCLQVEPAKSRSSGSAEERRLRRIGNTPQGEAIEGNPTIGGTDDALMVDQGPIQNLTDNHRCHNKPSSRLYRLRSKNLSQVFLAHFYSRASRCWILVSGCWIEKGFFFDLSSIKHPESRICSPQGNYSLLHKLVGLRRSFVSPFHSFRLDRWWVDRVPFSQNSLSEFSHDQKPTQQAGYPW